MPIETESTPVAVTVTVRPTWVDGVTPPVVIVFT